MIQEQLYNYLKTTTGITTLIPANYIFFAFLEENVTQDSIVFECELGTTIDTLDQDNMSQIYSVSFKINTDTPLKAYQVQTKINETLYGLEGANIRDINYLDNVLLYDDEIQKYTLASNYNIYYTP